MLSLNFNPFPVLETERLILREHVLADAKSLFAMRTNEEVMRYIDRERPKNVPDTELQINTLNAAYREGKNLTWIMALKEKPGQMIGIVGYWTINPEHHRAEIGYSLLPEHWRMGYTSEALKRTIDFGFKEMNFHSIQANINPGNDPSRQLLLKHGFVREAYFKENYYFNGQFLDSEVYSLLESAKSSSEPKH